MRYTSLTSGRRPKINASCNSNENSRVTFCWLSIYEKSRTTFPQPPKLRKFLRNFFPRKSRQRVLSLEEKFSEKFRRPYIRTDILPKSFVGCPWRFLNASWLEQSQTIWVAYFFTSECVWCAIHSVYSFHSEAGGKHKEYFLGTVHIAKSLRFFYQFRSNVERKWNGQNWPGKDLAFSSVNRGVALDSTCMIEAMFQKILVIVRLFSEQTELLRIKCWKEGTLLFWRHNRFYKSQSGLKELGQA